MAHDPTTPPKRIITKEEVQKLLDGTTPGPWEWAIGRAGNNPYLSPDVLLLAFDGGGPEGVDPNDASNARLIAAAPDLATFALAESARADQAEAANAALEARVLGLEDALRKHHEWHLLQDRDGNAWGIDPVDAYSESGMCEETCAALASGKPGEAEHPAPPDEPGPVDPGRRG